MTKRRQSSESDARTGATLTRRDALALGSGLVMLGTGIGVGLVPLPAAAGSPPDLELHFFRKGAKGFTSIGSIHLPAELASQLRTSDLEKVKVQWHRQRGKSLDLLKEHGVPASKALKAHILKKLPATPPKK